MPLSLQCPNPACAKVSLAPDELAGRSVRCKACGRAFVAGPTLDGRPSDTRPAGTTDDPFPKLPVEFGRYRVLRRLGRGGMGAVYLAEDTALHRQVALKIPTFAADESPQRVERFLREARAAAGLAHPNVCTVFDVGRQDGRPYITMAFIEGETLDAEIDPDRPMPERRAAELARSVARALQAAHDKGIVHRDLKPGNVMLTAAGEPVVMDFGLAKRVADAESEAKEAKLTRDGAVLGTPSYMAPEQVRGEVDRIGPHTDVYALGVMLFELLTGRVPYQGALGVVMGQILAAPLRPVAEFRPDADPRLDAICRRAMTKESGDRFPSMTAFAAALDDYLRESDPTVTASRSAVAAALPPAAAPAARRRWPLVAGGVVATLAIVAVALLLTGGTKQDKVTTEQTDPITASEREQTVSPPVAQPSVPPPTPADGFVPIFNGKDLTGWTAKYHKEKWSVENGSLVGRSDSFMIIHTERDDFADVHVRAKVRINDGGIAGLLVRRRNDDESIKDYGYRAQINATASGPQKTGSLKLGQNQTPVSVATSPVGPNEWFTLEVIAQGNRVRILVNGKMTADFTDPQSLYHRGWISLGVFSNAVVEFASIEVKELTASSPPPSSTPADGFEPLFNGKDLTGWRPLTNPNSSSAVEGGVLVVRGNGGYGKMTTLRDDFGNVHVRAKVRVNDGGSGGLIVRTGLQREEEPHGYYVRLRNAPAGNPNRTGSLYRKSSELTVAAPAVEAGPTGWVTLDVIADGDRVRVLVNGMLTVDYTDPDKLYARGRIGLRVAPNTVVEIASIEVKELPPGARPFRPAEPIPAPKVAPPTDPQAAVLAALKTDPNDPAANLARGKHLALTEFQWDVALAYLARAKDDGWQAAAKAEQAAGGTAEPLRTAGDAWWKLADTLAGREQYVVRRHAADVYLKAIPINGGGEKEPKLDRIRAIYGPPDMGKVKPVFDLDFRKAADAAKVGTKLDAGATVESDRGGLIVTVPGGTLSTSKSLGKVPGDIVLEVVGRAIPAGGGSLHSQYFGVRAAAPDLSSLALRVGGPLLPRLGSSSYIASFGQYERAALKHASEPRPAFFPNQPHVRRTPDSPDVITVVVKNEWAETYLNGILIRHSVPSRNSVKLARPADGYDIELLFDNYKPSTNRFQVESLRAWPADEVQSFYERNTEGNR